MVIRKIKRKLDLEREEPFSVCVCVWCVCVFYLLRDEEKERKFENMTLQLRIIWT